MVVAERAARFQMVARPESACHSATLPEIDPQAHELSYSVAHCQRPPATPRRRIWTGMSGAVARTRRRPKLACARRPEAGSLIVTNSRIPKRPIAESARLTWSETAKDTFGVYGD